MKKKTKDPEELEGAETLDPHTDPTPEHQTMPWEHQTTASEKTAPTHGECCEECKQTCKRSFWTQMLRSITKIATLLLAALGVNSINEQ